MLNKKTIVRDFSGQAHNVYQFLEMVTKYNEDGYDFYIGTDSQVHDNYVSIVTAICPHKIIEGTGRSSKVFYIKDRIKNRECPTLRSRMLLEAYRSLEIAMDLENHISTKISIHLDVGESHRSETRIYQKELQYLVTAQGYECKIKPDSWAAGSVADRFSKT